MAEKKILMLYVYDNQHELVETAVRQLIAKGVAVDALCITSYRYIKGSGIHWPYIFAVANFFINTIKMPKSKGIFYRLLHKRIFRLIDKYGIIDFESFPSRLHPFAEYCIKNEKDYVIVFWGSDMMLANEESMIQMKEYLDYSRSIGVTIQMKEKMDLFYNNHFGINYESKYTGVLYGKSFGDKDIFILDSLSDKDLSRSRKLLGIRDSSKILITIGYNGIPAQNQDRVLGLMKQLPNALKKRIQVVIPMTYGATPEHMASIKSTAEQSGFSYIVLDRFLANKDICGLRKLTDVFIMVQNTDAFAASVKGHIYSQNVCLIGEWLDYPIDEKGVYYEKINWSNFVEKLQDVLVKIDSYRVRCDHNRERMLPFMSWDGYVAFKKEQYNID